MKWLIFKSLVSCVCIFPCMFLIAVFLNKAIIIFKFLIKHIYLFFDPIENDIVQGHS